MTEQDIKEIGFNLVKQYQHDDFHTNRYRKGLIEVEFTYKNDELLTIDAAISEINCIPVNKSDLQTLDKIINK